jgi:hypothetical protein
MVSFTGGSIRILSQIALAKLFGESSANIAGSRPWLSSNIERFVPHFSSDR